MSVGALASAVGKGLFAGVAGTAAMTVSSTLEARLSNREPSTAPADAAAKVLGVEPVGDQEKARFSTFVHWGYGTAWGAPRGVLAVVGLPASIASAIHLGMVWGSEVVMLPRLGVAPPLSEMPPRSVVIDGFHHTVYAVVTGLTYAFLNRSKASA